MIPDFELARPATLEEAVRQVADGGMPYVGGTELIAAMNIGLVAPPRLIDLKRLDELRGVTVADEVLTIAAATRHDEVAASDAVLRYAPMLATACSQLGNMRVRATGSIGGNICFADPRSDVSTALFALDALVTLRSPGGIRTMGIGDFVLGAMEADRADDELLTAITVPIRHRHHVYLRHQPAEYPTVCVAMTVDADAPRGPVAIVVGAVGERPFRCTAPGLDSAGAGSVPDDLEVIEDLNGSEEYKRHLAGVFADRAAVALREVIDA